MMRRSTHQASPSITAGSRGAASTTSAASLSLSARAEVADAGILVEGVAALRGRDGAERIGGLLVGVDGDHGRGERDLVGVEILGIPRAGGVLLLVEEAVHAGPCSRRR